MNDFDKLNIGVCPCDTHNKTGPPNISLDGSVVCYRTCSLCGKDNDMTLWCFDCKKKKNPWTYLLFPKLLELTNYPERGFNYLYNQNSDRYAMANYPGSMPEALKVAKLMTIILRAESISKIYDYESVNESVYNKSCSCKDCAKDEISCKDQDIANREFNYDKDAPVYYGAKGKLIAQCRFNRCRCGLILSCLGSTTFCRACDF